MKIKRWTLDYLTDIIVYSILSKFDFIIMIEGKRSLGKSTLAYKIAKMTAKKLKRVKEAIGYDKKDYRFVPEKNLMYSLEEISKFMNKWYKIGIADEMINAGFLRDFWKTGQNDLIKKINMNRDHQNILLACIPRFQDLDNKLKNLCKLRITIVRRGISIIQTPNKSIYSSDIWDTC